MAGLYVVAIVPLSLTLRALGRDLLRTKWEATASSYWIKRNPPGPSAGSMAKQF